MDTRLSQAVAAARDGQKEEAQRLLVQLLEEDPDEAQGWFLLSNLVDDPGQKQTFLGRVLALDPDHAVATAQWQQLHAGAASPATMAISASDNVLAQAEGDSLPDWLAGDADNLRLDKRDAAPELEMDLEELTAVAADETKEEIPQWLQGEADLESGVTALAAARASQQTDATAVAPKPRARKTARTPAAKPRRSGQERNLTVILYVLSGVAVLVFLALIYLVITNL